MKFFKPLFLLLTLFVAGCMSTADKKQVEKDPAMKPVVMKKNKVMRDEVLDPLIRTNVCRPVLVFYTSPSCYGSRKMQAMIFEIIKNFDGEISYKEVNVVQEEDLAREKKIVMTPCAVIYIDDKEMERTSNTMDKDKMKKFIYRAFMKASR